MRPGRVRVKICCISSPAEAMLAVRYGASAIGLVSEMPSGPGVISEESIAEIAAGVPPGVSSFLLTSRRSVEEIVAQQHRCNVDTLQICDRLPAAAHRQLAKELPAVRRVQVVHVRDRSSVDEALELAPRVDALLLDSGNQELAIRELGGTGRTHDWSISREIVERSPVPVYLAGGLRPDNVAEAVRQVGPFGVDLCTGVRRDGSLDESRLGRFFSALR